MAKRITHRAMLIMGMATGLGFVLFTSLCFPQSESQNPTPANDALFPAVVARVNGVEIPGRALEDLVRRELSTIGNPEWKNLRGEYRGQLVLTNLTLLINSKLIFQKAAASGIKATNLEVQAEMQKIEKTFKNEAEMNKALANENMDRAALEKNIFERLTASKYVDATLKNKIAVTPEEAAKFYSSSNQEELQHPDIARTSQILIKVTGEDAAAKKRAEALLARIQKGEDFAKLARENSMDSSAAQGGDTGYASKDSLAPEYADAAFSLPVGTIALVRTQAGYHVIKVVDRKKEGLFTLEEIKPQLIERLKNKKYQEELDKLVKQLRENANIEILISAGELLKP
jgi:parvulin-like peptidyl-prolyl isomerase